MTIKQLTTGSIVLMFIFVFISFGMNSAVDQSIKLSNNQPNQKAPTPKTQPFKAEVHQGGQSAADLVNSGSQITFGESKAKKNLITSIVEKGIIEVYTIFNPPEPTQSSPDLSMSNYADYQAYFEQNPLSPEDTEILSKYTDKSPLELLQSYCEDAKTPEFKEMINSIKDSYGNDPSSPAGLMKMFETTAKLCP
jgi:hypothetical protein